MSHQTPNEGYCSKKICWLCNALFVKRGKNLHISQPEQLVTESPWTSKDGISMAVSCTNCTADEASASQAAIITVITVIHY